MKRVRRVLVVENDHEIREPFTTFLVDAGYEVQTASTGLDALRMARARPPDVIVLDLRMPVMNAGGFRRAQRSDPRLGRIPVVARVPRDEVDVIVRVVERHHLHTLLSAFPVLENSAVLVPLRGGRE
jgi:CheY-like chemotaxis protein